MNATDTISIEENYKFAVDNIVQVPIKFTLKEGSVNKLFSFSLTAVRRTPEEIEEQPELTIKEFLLENVTDWAGQRLVLKQNNEPAPFTKKSFDYMLKQSGLLAVVWQSYQRECGAKEKN